MHKKPGKVAYLPQGAKVRRFASIALPIALLAGVSMARGQSSNAGAAESLFQTGKSLLEAKNYSFACPKLAESYRLDPGTGTLLALALCHEGDGRLATAWGEYAEVAARSRREARPDREELARHRMAALDDRLPMVTISVAPGGETIEGLEIKRDGVVVGSGSWATPVPVDPGHHHIEATAPGYKPFAMTVNLEAEAHDRVVVIPVLEHALEVPERPVSGAQGDSGNALRYGGLAMGGLGVVGLVVGTAFGVHAIGLNNDSKADCDANSVCGPTGVASRRDARSAGDASTAAFVAGGVLLAGGATMVLLAKPRSTGGISLRAAPVVFGRELGVRFDGVF
jgi:hypothetical protein